MSPLTPSTFIEILQAAHLTRYVVSEFEQRSGVMIVAPPGQLKSTFVEMAMRPFSDCLVLSNLNVRQLSALKSDLSAKRYSTLAFPSYEALYKKAEKTSSYVEGTLMDLVQDGYYATAFEDSRMMGIRARACVIAAITEQCYKNMFQEWEQSGFLRRFLWVFINVCNPEEITRAIRNGRKIDLGDINFRIPTRDINFASITEDQSMRLEPFLRDQRGGTDTPYVMLKKIFAVLSWKYKDPQIAFEKLREFSPTLLKGGGEIKLPKASYEIPPKQTRGKK